MLTLENRQPALDRLRAELLARLGDGVESLTLRGSAVDGDAVWSGSDIDLIVVASPGQVVGVDYLRHVAAACAVVEETFAIPVSPLVGTWNDVRMLLSPVLLKSIAHNGVTLAGRDLLPAFEQEWRKFPALEIARASLCAMFFQRFAIHQHLLEAGAGPGRDVHWTRSKALWKAFVKVCRFGVWVRTAHEERLENALLPILEQFDRVYADVEVEVHPRAAFAAMQAWTPPVEDLTPGIVATCERLVAATVEGFRRQFHIRDVAPFLYPH